MLLKDFNFDKEKIVTKWFSSVEIFGSSIHRSAKQIFRIEANFPKIFGNFSKLSMDFVSIKPFYFYDVNWLWIPGIRNSKTNDFSHKIEFLVYEFFQFCTGGLFIFRCLTAVVKSKKFDQISSLAKTFLLGLLLATSWIPIFIYGRYKKLPK